MSDPIDGAVRAARAGRLVVIPTDTVYGIGTRPDDPRATARLFEAKGRPRELELPILVPGAPAARAIAAFDARADALATRFWAGALTLVLPRTRASAGWDLGGDPATIGIRMPHHPLALALLSLAGPLAVTSANRSGRRTLATCAELLAEFGDAVEVYLCEEEPLEGRPSTVVDLTASTARILRAGVLGEREIRDVLDPVEGRAPEDEV
ncbi:MAG TPA: L-threonylcarbamoyladenylate synthase [Actinomycetota bacterium]|nr:L-threonylcarbamoyladenylate synthase [Actinomycetota bacterium]